MSAPASIRHFIRGRLHLVRLAAVALAIVSGWGARTAFADQKTGTIGGVTVISTTDGLSVDQFGHKSNGSSQAYSSANSIEAHTHGYNNDGGWHEVDREDVYGSGTFARTGTTYAGGRYGGGAYQCTGGVQCYVATQHYYSFSSGSGFEYTSSDGGHSSEGCWVTPGC